MKKVLALLASLTLLGTAATSYGSATVWLNNYDPALNLIYTGSVGSGNELSGGWVEFFGGPQGGALKQIANNNGATKFAVGELLPGMFDGLLGIIPDVADNAAVTIRARIWSGAADFDAAVSGLKPVADVQWNQNAGAWAGPPSPPSGAAMQFPANVTLNVVPEPSTIALGLLGAAALLIRRRK